ncbi:MAG TPA: hypothetical protein VKQ11_10640 [Candidatus Sulfotelmatobacter sp.]|nr:hypothetical protein [Candidatus Sulfotelmatobacter sp.]
MSNDKHLVNTPEGHAHGDYERRDIGIAGVLYFLAALVVAGVFVHFIVTGLYRYLDHRYETEQPAVSPLVKNQPQDTRHIPPQYNGDYDRYLKENFPAPQLEVDERTQLNDVRLREEDNLSTYDYVDKNAGTIHIPIDRAMDLLVQRGLPVRSQSQEAATAPPQAKKGSR